MLQECTAWRVLQVFFNEPTASHYLKEISRKTDISHTSVKNHLETLADQNLITVGEEQRGERTYPLYEAATENEQYKLYKRINMLSRIHETGLLTHLEDMFTPDCIVLFGSAARGEDIEESDIDLFIQATEQDHDLTEYEEKLHRTIQLHVTPDVNTYPAELQRNIANGITLTGFLDVIP